MISIANNRIIDDDELNKNISEIDENFEVITK